jgi:hypothetical protein
VSGVWSERGGVGSCALRAKKLIAVFRGLLAEPRGAPGYLSGALRAMAGVVCGGLGPGGQWIWELDGELIGAR